jgi:RNA 2',3'-cyclic 3'-phosphodiesterase
VKRCFVAAWPDHETRGKLAKLALELAPHCDSSRALRPENLHLTLAFIGNLPETTTARVAGAIQRLRLAPFVWRLDNIVHFARPGVLAAAGKHDASLGLLAAAARGALDQLAVDYDRKPFLPHVTLLRKVAGYDGRYAFAPAIDWRIDNVALYQSTQGAAGATYQPVELI